MANCTKCNKVFTCGCQKASLSDGSIVCKNCKSEIENTADADFLQVALRAHFVDTL